MMAGPDKMRTEDINPNALKLQNSNSYNDLAYAFNRRVAVSTTLIGFGKRVRCVFMRKRVLSHKNHDASQKKR